MASANAVGSKVAVQKQKPGDPNLARPATEHSNEKEQKDAQMGNFWSVWRILETIDEVTAPFLDKQPKDKPKEVRVRRCDSKYWNLNGIRVGSLGCLDQSDEGSEHILTGWTNRMRGGSCLCILAVAGTGGPAQNEATRDIKSGVLCASLAVAGAGGPVRNEVTL